MDNYDKEIVDDKLTQADLIKLMLHNAQHMATRDEVKADINKLDTKIDKVETSLREDINKLDTKIDKVETSLREDINKLDTKIDKVDNKFDRMQWLIISTIVVVLLKDQIIGLLTTFVK